MWTVAGIIYIMKRRARAQRAKTLGVRRRDVPPRGFKEKEREKVVVPADPAVVAREKAGTGDSSAH
jgi:hypothetical protein